MQPVRQERGNIAWRGVCCNGGVARRGGLKNRGTGASLLGFLPIGEEAFEADVGHGVFPEFFEDGVGHGADVGAARTAG